MVKVGLLTEMRESPGAPSSKKEVNPAKRHPPESLDPSIGHLLSFPEVGDDADFDRDRTPAGARNIHLFEDG